MALGCGLVASIGITQVMAKRDVGPVSVGDTERIFVAKKDIQVSDPITAEMVKLEDWPKANLPAGAMLKWEDLESRRPKMLIAAGCPILESQLRGKGAIDAGPDVLIPKGHLVVPVKVDPSSGGVGIIRPGARVDVLAYIKPDPTKTIIKPVTRTVLQDVKVFAVDEIWDTASGVEEKPIRAKTISLLVTPEQAEILTMACELGSIRLAMRSPEDSERRALRGTDARDLGVGLAAVEPSREPPLPQRVEQPEKGGGDIRSFLEGLTSKKKEPPAKVVEAPPPPPKETPAPEPKKEIFTVRILEGSRLTDVVLESPAQGGAGDKGGESPSRWKISNTSRPAPADRIEPSPGSRLPGFTPPEPRPTSGEKKPGTTEQDKERARPTGK
jgi:pilus assembly protein CpaB